MKKRLILTTIITTFITGSMLFAGNGNMAKKKMSLSEGWNLKGSVVGNVDINAIQNSECINSMWKWNNQEKKWEMYSPDENVQNLMKKYKLRKIDKINEGEGFWIHAKENCEIELMGTPPSVNDGGISTSSVDTSFETAIDTLDSASDNNENMEPAYCKLFENAEKVDFTGTVKEIPETGKKSMNGFIFTTDSGEEIVLYGLGPVKFWEDAEIERPVEGDTLTIEAFKITLDDGSTKYVINKITDADGNSLTLRDDTGLPVWAKGKLGNKEEHDSGSKKYKWGKNNHTNHHQ